jgi:micrococcal nuclease
MNLTKSFFLLPLLFLITLAAASTYEATGRVTHVVDGDTFDVQIQDHDNRITEDLVRIRFADIDCPETRGLKACEAGKNATDYTRSWLLNNLVYPDLDNKTGKDQFGRWVAVVYLTNLDGSLNLTRNFNKMLVDSGHAVIEDFKNNEFDPQSWWKLT